MELYDLFLHSGPRARVRKLATKDEFFDTLLKKVNGLKNDYEFLNKKYDEYCELYKSIRLGPGLSAKSILGFTGQATTLNYYLVRGWTLDEARQKLKERQGGNSAAVVARKKNLSIEEAQLVVKSRSIKGQETLKRRDDYDKIKFSHGNGNRVSYLVTKINPDTGKNYTEEEAKQKIFKKQQKGMLNMWADVKAGKRIYYANTMLEYYLVRGYSLEQSKLLLKTRQATFSLQKCIAEHGSVEGPQKWKARQEKWLQTLNSFSDEKKKEILIKKTTNSKRYSKEATIFIMRLLDKLGINNTDDDVFMCDTERFLWEDNNIVFFDLYIGRFNLYLEYNGSSWHPNPKKLDTKEKWNTWIHPILKISANEMQERDNRKQRAADKNGGLFFCVWDTDDHSKKIEEIVSVLNNSVKEL